MILLLSSWKFLDISPCNIVSNIHIDDVISNIIQFWKLFYGHRNLLFQRVVLFILATTVLCSSILLIVHSTLGLIFVDVVCHSNTANFLICIFFYLPKYASLESPLVLFASSVAPLRFLVNCMPDQHTWSFCLRFHLLDLVWDYNSLTSVANLNACSTLMNLHQLYLVLPGRSANSSTETASIALILSCLSRCTISCISFEPSPATN